MTAIRHAGGLTRPAQAIVLGGIAAGVLDLLYCTIYWGLQGAAPIRISQSVASGLLGPAAFQGGYWTALLGIGLEVAITLAMAYAYYLVSRKIPALTRHPLICGALYGVFLHFFMSDVVLPLSLFTQAAFSWPWFINSMIASTLFIGVPCALAARAARRLEPTQPMADAWRTAGRR